MLGFEALASIYRPLLHVRIEIFGHFHLFICSLPMENPGAISVCNKGVNSKNDALQKRTISLIALVRYFLMLVTLGGCPPPGLGQVGMARCAQGGRFLCFCTPSLGAKRPAYLLGQKPTPKSGCPGCRASEAERCGFGPCPPVLYFNTHWMVAPVNTRVLQLHIRMHKSG